MFLWLRSGHGEIGCATVITNLAKVQRKQIEREKLVSSDTSSLQLPPVLICSGNSPQTHWFHASDWISMHLWWDGKGKTTYLSTRVDWQADARSKWQVISALSEIFMHVLLYVAMLSLPIFHMAPLISVPLRAFSQLQSKQHSQSDKHLWPFSDEVVRLFKWLLPNCLLHKVMYREMK